MVDDEDIARRERYYQFARPTRSCRLKHSQVPPPTPHLCPSTSIPFLSYQFPDLTLVPLETRKTTFQESDQRPFQSRQGKHATKTKESQEGT